MGDQEVTADDSAADSSGTSPAAPSGSDTGSDTGRSRKKKRSTVITVQMVSRKAQLDGQKVNTMQVAAESKFADLLARREDSAFARNPAFKMPVPLKTRRILTEPASTSFEVNVTERQNPCRSPAATGLRVDTNQTGWLDLQRFGASGARLRAAPQFSPNSVASWDGLLSCASRTQLPGTSVSDTNLSHSVHQTPHGKSHDAILSPLLYNVTVTEDAPITASASDSSINITYHRPYRKRVGVSAHHGSYEVIEETDRASPADILFEKMREKRAVSESGFDGRASQRKLEAASRLKKDTWTSHPQLQTEVTCSEPMMSGWVLEASDFCFQPLVLENSVAAAVCIANSLACCNDNFQLPACRNHKCLAAKLSVNTKLATAEGQESVCLIPEQQLSLAGTRRIVASLLGEKN